MSEIYTSFEEVTKAYNQVRDELIELGVLWRDSKLDKVPCIYVTIPLEAFIKGWMGYWIKEEKAIHFPSVYLPLPYLRGSKNSALDVIRHEFGHALADLYPTALSKGGLFKEAFGAKYGPNPAPDTDPDNWEFDFVSPYAARATQEDFAETFMLFLKHKGKLPRKFAGKPAIKKKWAAVAEIVKRVRASEN